MKGEQLEQETTTMIQMVGKQRKTKMDENNPLLRMAMKEIILAKHREAREKQEEEVLLQGQVQTQPQKPLLPGCRELFGDLLAVPGPFPHMPAIDSRNLMPFERLWQFVDESRTR